MTAVITESNDSGNPALGSKAASALFAETSPRTMTVGGTSFKTLLLARSCSWPAARGAGRRRPSPSASISASGYANTTVTIPGGFWLASFGAFFVGIFVAINPRRAALLGVVYAVLAGLLPRRDLGGVRRADRRHRRRRNPEHRRRVPRRAAAVRHAHRAADPEARVRASSPASAGSRCSTCSCGCSSIFDWGFLYSEEFRTVGIVVTVIAVILAALSLTLDFGVHRGVRRRRRAEVHGVVRGLRPDGHAHLAVHHAAAAARASSPATDNAAPPLRHSINVTLDGCCDHRARAIALA